MSTNKNFRRKLNTSSKTSLVYQSLPTVFLPGDKKQWGKRSQQGLKREKLKKCRTWELERGKVSNKKRLKQLTVQKYRMPSEEGQQAPSPETQLKVIYTLGSSFTRFWHPGPWSSQHTRQNPSLRRWTSLNKAHESSNMNPKYRSISLQFVIQLPHRHENDQNVPFLKMSSMQSQILIRQQFDVKAIWTRGAHLMNWMLNGIKENGVNQWEKIHNVRWLQLPVSTAITGMALPTKQSS